MSVITDYRGESDQYEVVELPSAEDVSNGVAKRDGKEGKTVLLHRSARPSRRAVLYLRDQAQPLAPPNMDRWYNERGFHFYSTQLQPDAAHAGRRPRTAKAAPKSLAVLDSACKHLREAGGIDAIIVSAEGSAALAAALWCDAQGASHPVEALILSRPDFAGAPKAPLAIGCPVLVLSPSRPNSSTGHAGRDLLMETLKHVPRPKRDRRVAGHGHFDLGKHVTWLYLDDGTDATNSSVDLADRRLFDEMGRWLGAYMYGQVRDQLL